MLKQAIPKTHFQARAPCSHPFSLAAQRVSWDWGTADPRWALSEQQSAWRENPICESKQWVTGTGRTELWELSPHLSTARAQQVTQAGAAPSAMASTPAPRTTKIQPGSDSYSPNSKVLEFSDNLFIVSSCGRAPALLVGFYCPTQQKSLNIIAQGTCFWQNPTQHLCLVLIFRTLWTFEGTDTSKCYMSCCDFAFLGITFICLIVISVIFTVGCFQKVSFLSGVLSFISLQSELLKQKTPSPSFN